jgi:putative hemolysin
VPKTLAMNNAEGITIALALFMNVFTKLTKPVVWFLSISTKIVLKIFRIKSRNDQYMSEEELILLLKQVSEQGVIESEESEIITEVMRLGDKKALNILVPRKDVCWLDLNNPVEELIRMASASSYSKLLVCESNIETIKGYIIVKDLLIEYFVKGNHNLTDILINPHFIPEQMSAVKILSLFRDSKKHFGVVVNEFGDISGIITLHDLAENIMGDFPEINENFSPDVVERDDKSWLVNGSMPVSDFKSNFSIPYFYKKNKDPESVATVGGLIMFLLKSIPKEGDSIILFNYRIEVVDMDGLRVDKVLISTIK